MRKTQPIVKMLPELVLWKWSIHVILSSCLTLFCSSFTNRVLYKSWKEVKCSCATNVLLWVLHQHSRRTYTNNLIVNLKICLNAWYLLNTWYLNLPLYLSSLRPESLFRNMFLQLSGFWKDCLLIVVHSSL